MSLPKEKREEIRGFLLYAIFEKREGFIRETTEKFGISRQAVNRYLQSLMEQDFIEKKGTGRSTEYNLKRTEFRVHLNVDKNLREDVVWRNDILPKLPELKRNVLDICQHGFTEMLNNVIDHSESKDVLITIIHDFFLVTIMIIDNGVGIFNKIQKDLGLLSPQEAIIELEKGKFTSDPLHHTGEGIFYTSRLFDDFHIISEKISFSGHKADDYLVFTPDKKDIVFGTIVIMKINKNSNLLISDVFNEYASEESDYGFSKTVILVNLMLTKNENLVSRSQAKRLTAGLEKFKQVVLDFSNISIIGQGFADQVFRVFKNDHPDIEIIPTNAGEDVMRMIMHVLNRK
jgi:anti-sigma regulatory factor (Ser/Thr protein kinase)